MHNKLKIILYLFPLLVYTSFAFSIANPPQYSFQDYQNLSYEKEEFNAACQIRDFWNGPVMSGVLIDSQIVLTAAHGFPLKAADLSSLSISSSVIVLKAKNLSVTFQFKNNKQKLDEINIPVVAIVVDRRFYDFVNSSQTQDNKFDFAFLVLKHPPYSIKPASFLHEADIDQHSIMTVVTYGTSDLFWGNAARRAFNLYERDIFYPLVDRYEMFSSYKYLALSSIYFKPYSHKNDVPAFDESEEELRSYQASKLWKKDQQKPYGLALPGTSGSGVFIHLFDKYTDKIKTYLIGVVSAFAPLSHWKYSDKNLEIKYIRNNPLQSLGNYQTIISTFYQVGQKQNYKKKNIHDEQIDHFVIDQRFMDALHTAKNIVKHHKSSSPTQKSFVDMIFSTLHNLF
ncbi:MAG: hypothetical protein C0432_05210 [Candidatus Puniceispirillum sp.]|nr:hypothetical protein [Candidatus Pelagibacter sp.]MBA4283674.1 hypothetical protein [Candidatus Puniceispirillum sp.]